MVPPDVCKAWAAGLQLPEFPGMSRPPRFVDLPPPPPPHPLWPFSPSTSNLVKLCVCVCQLVPSTRSSATWLMNWSAQLNMFNSLARLHRHCRDAKSCYRTRGLVSVEAGRVCGLFTIAAHSTYLNAGQCIALLCKSSQHAIISHSRMQWNQQTPRSTTPCGQTIGYYNK